MQAHHSKNASVRDQVLAQKLVAIVIESPLGQHHGHAATGLQKAQVALNKKNGLS
jgi:hypothetical protein